MNATVAKIFTFETLERSEHRPAIIRRMIQAFAEICRWKSVKFSNCPSFSRQPKQSEDETIEISTGESVPGQVTQVGKPKLQLPIEKLRKKGERKIEYPFVRSRRRLSSDSKENVGRVKEGTDRFNKKRFHRSHLRFTR